MNKQPNSFNVCRTWSFKNIKVENPVELVDVFPTLFELAGVKTPKRDGKSLVPLIDNDERSTIDVDYAYHQYARGKRMGYGIRTDRYRYVEWHDNDYRAFKPYKEENIVGVPACARRGRVSAELSVRTPPGPGGR